MRLFTSGSAPLLPQTFSAFQEATGHTIVERYGMTETGMNTSNPIAGARKLEQWGYRSRGCFTASSTTRARRLANDPWQLAS